MSAAMRLCAHDHKSNAMKVDAGVRENVLRSISSNMVRGSIGPAKRCNLVKCSAPRGAA